MSAAPQALTFRCCRRHSESRAPAPVDATPPISLLQTAEERTAQMRPCCKPEIESPVSGCGVRVPSCRRVPERQSSRGRRPKATDPRSGTQESCIFELRSSGRGLLSTPRCTHGRCLSSPGAAALRAIAVREPLQRLRRVCAGRAQSMLSPRAADLN